MRKKWIALTVLALVAAGGYVGMQNADRLTAAFQDGRAPDAAKAAAPDEPARGSAAPVEVAEARVEASRSTLSSVGSLASDESVQIAAEVAGRIAEMAFAEGEPVRAGDVMVRLDDALARAELAEVQAGLQLAEQNFERANSLSRSGAGTQRARDEAQAALTTSRAAVELAQVRLDKTQIRAPFDGVAGLRLVSPGAYAQIGQAIVNLEKIDELKLDFRVPEVSLADVGVGQKVQIVVDAFPSRTFSGEIYAIDPLVDVNGRAVRVRARVANDDGVLRPGLFARVTVEGRSRGDVVMVPESALVPRGEELFVYAIDNGRAVERRVRIGRRLGGNVEISEGVPPQTMIVVAGQPRLRDGARVEIVTAAAAAPRG